MRIIFMVDLHGSQKKRGLEIVLIYSSLLAVGNPGVWR